MKFNLADRDGTVSSLVACAIALGAEKPAVLTFAEREKFEVARANLQKSYSVISSVVTKSSLASIPQYHQHVCQMTCTMSDKHQLVNASEKLETVYHSL